MELGTFGWVMVGWFAVSVVVSLTVGWFLREVNATADDSELDQVLSRRRIVRYLRRRKPDHKPAGEKVRRHSH